MGYGDALLAAGMAQEQYAKAPERGPVLICDGNGRPRWRAEWDGNPMIMPPNGRGFSAAPRITVGGNLPYHPWNPSITWQARDHRGSIYLTRQEIKRGLGLRARYGPFVMIEPTGQDRKNVNRYWSGWPELARILKHRIDMPLLQLDRRYASRLPGVHLVAHDTYRDACAILKAASLGVLTEGGITFAAAAVKTPAVVLWGGCVSVHTFGYPEHVNLTGLDPQRPCGASRPCDHCAEAWRVLTPELVADAVVAKAQQLREAA